MTDEPRNRVYNFLNKVDGFLNKVDKFLHKHIDPHFWTIISVLAIVLIVLIAVEVIDSTSGVTDDNDIAQRLGDAGWELYTSSRCSFCDVQKDVLISTNGLVVYECDMDVDDNQMCIDNNVTVVPTWINVESGEVIQGMQTVEQLEVMINA
ncbi:hypothetical protein KAR91_74380 [Candidatus Pacearchaeota archaeon]|nr:hypothetical protein [Candidatus Pacearchaeota archaeon]